jgi:hypothetical protein
MYITMGMEEDMSKKTRTENKKKRLAMKRARRTANQARYIAMKEAGENSKSKRFLKNAKRILVRKHNHPQVPCGNPGCGKCYPSLAIC